MLINRITSQIIESKLPNFWLAYIVFVALTGFSVFFFQESNWLHPINLFIHSLVFIGILAGFRFHKQKSHPRLLLVSGAGVIAIAKVLESAISLGIPIHSSTYHFAGALSILFIFIEKLSVNYSSVAPTRLGSQFMWIASIIAIIAIPFGLVIHSLIYNAQLNLLVVGLASIFLSVIVVWRLIILISNTNQQRQRLLTGSLSANLQPK